MDAAGGREGEIKIQERFDGPMLVVWFSLVVLFAVFLVLATIGAAVVFFSLKAGQGTADDIGKLLGVLLSFNGAKINAFLNGSMASAGTVFLVGGAALAVIVALLQRSIERTRFKRLTVTPLLPGVKRRFIPCEEGIYTRWFGSRYTGSVWYSLRPWGSLVIDTLDETKRRITLRDGRTTMHLRAQARPGDQTSHYESLKQVVLSHLPAERQTPQPKKLGFRWGVCLALVFAAVALSTLGLRSLDAHTKGTAGDGRCDVCGRGLSWGYVQVLSVKKVVHEYCELHGLAHAVVHPAMALRSAAIEIPAMAREEGLAKALAGNSSAVYGPLVWWTVGWIIVLIAAPKPLVLDR